ncbi:hypothetical protein FRC08_004412 [Ceratobasidium sp. 394]|nr:hypothetical protein FRC08_004412 [Ceratobasidium sp. 394]
MISIDAANNNRTPQTALRHYRHSRQQPLTLVAYSSLFKWRAHPGYIRAVVDCTPALACADRPWLIMPGAKSNAKPGATVPITDHHDAQPNPDQLLKRNAPDTIEQPALAKKQRVATKEATTKAVPKGKTAGTNAATNCTDSWSASYHQEVASLPPPPAPKKTQEKRGRSACSARSRSVRPDCLPTHRLPPANPAAVPLCAPLLLLVPQPKRPCAQPGRN